MTTAAWIQDAIKDFLPTDDMVGGDVSIRLPRLMAARADIDQGYALGAEFADGEIPAATAALDQALVTWRRWLVEQFGDEGEQFFHKAQLAHGLVEPAAKSVARDPEIAAALERLRAKLADTAAATAHWRGQGWLEDDLQHGHAIAPPAANAGVLLARFEIDADPLPAALEALYAELDGLWTGVVAPPGGARPFDAQAEELVFLSLDELITLNEELGADTELILFDRDPDSFRWTMLSREDGAVYSSTKFDRDEPRRVADSLAAYIDALAARYGYR